MKTKLDARLEAARLTIDSEAEDFTKKATEIYDFLVKDIELPDADVINPVDMMSKYLNALSPKTTDIENEESVKSEAGEA